MNNVEFWAALIKAIAIPLAVVNTVPLLVWVERRGSALMQDRVGPNRAAIYGIKLKGLLHPLADAFKFLTKEPFIPAAADRIVYLMAPALLLVPALCAFAAIPIADVLVLKDAAGVSHSIPMQVAPIPAGVLYVLALGSLSIYGIVFGGWASGSQYSLLGGLRSAAQLISYELAMGLAVAAAILLYSDPSGRDGAPDAGYMVHEQGRLLFGFLPKWGVFVQPVGFIIFLVAGFAETNRLPFDMPEGEAELVAGYHTEYGGMKFSMFMMAEYVAMVTVSGMIVTLYLGGWQIPYWSPQSMRAALGPWGAAAAQAACFAVKVAFFLFFFIWVRWTAPRFRYDQVMRLGWKVLLPLALIHLVVYAAVIVARHAPAA